MYENFIVYKKSKDLRHMICVS